MLNLSRATLIALAVFVSCTSLFLITLTYKGASLLYSEFALVAAIFLSISLITVTVYQSIRINETAQSIATGMANNMALYSRELSTQLFRGSPVPYILINSKFRIESLNIAAVRLFMTKDNALDGQDVLDLLSEDPESKQKRLELLPEYFKQGMPIHDVELCVKRTDGSVRYVLVSIFSFEDTEGIQKGLLTLVDMTKQKEVDRAKTEFVSLASHQLRTPISAMKWNIELYRQVRGTEVPELEVSYLDKIERGATRMETLINDFLSVSKLELGTLTPTYEDITLGTFFDSVIEEHENKAAARKITIMREWKSDAERNLHTDTHLLNMAVSNLVSNAVKYTKDGGVVRVSTHVEPDSLVISVSDTGIGIPESEQERVFSKIFRAANAKAQVQEGTGLGLYIVREALKVMGGTITFVSKENEGTTFTVVLPNA